MKDERMARLVEVMKEAGWRVNSVNITNCSLEFFHKREHGASYISYYRDAVLMMEPGDFEIFLQQAYEDASRDPAELWEALAEMEEMGAMDEIDEQGRSEPADPEEEAWGAY